MHRRTFTLSALGDVQSFEQHCDLLWLPLWNERGKCREREQSWGHSNLGERSGGPDRVMAGAVVWSDSGHVLKVSVATSQPCFAGILSPNWAIAKQ